MRTTLVDWFKVYIRATMMQQPNLRMISDRHRGILVVMNDDYLCLGLRYAITVSVYVILRVTSILCSTIKLLLVRATYERQTRKFEYQMQQVARLYPKVHG